MITIILQVTLRLHLTFLQHLLQIHEPHLRQALDLGQGPVTGLVQGLVQDHVPSLVQGHDRDPDQDLNIHLP